ncbi:MAG: ABC transporter ATP-binding protein [Candidatus Bathyarchaeia archaeon]
MRLKVCLEVVGLSKYFGSIKAVDHVNLRVYEGELISIIGPNGAGKTTLINLISRWLIQDSGSIFFYEMDISKITKPHKATKLGIVRSFQLLNIFENLTVFDNICLALLSKYNKSFKMFSPLSRDKKLIEEVHRIAETFGLDQYLDKPAKGMPHGSKKLLDVAIAYALNPRLLLLDEPTSGVTTAEKLPLMDIIKRAVSERGITTIMVEHDMDIVFSYSNRIVIMHSGKILAEGKPKEILESAEIAKVIGE